MKCKTKVCLNEADNGGYCEDCNYWNDKFKEEKEVIYDYL